MKTELKIYLKIAEILLILELQKDLMGIREDLPMWILIAKKLWKMHWKKMGID